MDQPMNVEIKIIFFPWKAQSVFPSKIISSCNHYHLHPELVYTSEKWWQTYDNAHHTPIVIICDDCCKTIQENKIPNKSIAAGVDFGSHDRVGLVSISLQEIHIISFVRHYYNIIKLETNTRRLRDHQQSAIKGSSIIFDHDAPHVVTDLLSPDSMNADFIL